MTIATKPVRVMMNVDAFIVRDNERLSERILVEVVDVVQASVDERKVGL